MADTERARTPHEPMFDHYPERRRYIRSRADLEFQLARMTLALSRAPLARQPELRDWFDEAAAGLVARAAPEHREYVEERVASIRETFFGEPPAMPRASRDLHELRGTGRGGSRMH
jgi:hypothetical protein